MSASTVQHAAAVLDAGRPADALNLLGAHLAQNPDDASGLRVASESLRLLGRGPEALTTAEHAMRIDPEDSRNWNVLAFGRLSVGDAPGAIAAAVESANRAPGDWTTHANLAAISSELESTGNLPLDASLEAIRLAPNSSVAHSIRGLALLRRNQPKLAIASFTTALRLDPHNTSAQHNMAIAALRTGDPAAAAANLAALTAQAPSDALALSNLRVAIGNTLGQVHSVVFLGAFSAVQVMRITSPGSDVDVPWLRAAMLITGLAVLGVAAFLVIRARHKLGAALAPIFRFALSRDRLLAVWAVLDGLALIPFAIGPLLPTSAWLANYGFAWLFVFVGLILRLIRGRMMRAAAQRRR